MTIGMNEEPMIFFLLMVCGGLLFYGIRTFRDLRLAREREQTKRELAAYVAEGTIKPEDATAILNAGNPAEPASNAEHQIATGAAWGTLHPDKAASLLRALRNPRNAAE
jgi:hypothetical protein